MATIPETQLDRVLAHLDKIHEKADALIDGHKKLSDRMDALEAEREKEKTDAKAKADDDEEKERADKARKDAEECEKVDKRRLDSIDQDVQKFAAAQMRADSAYQAWGKQAPHALHGEALRDFRVRLLRPMQKHSRTYKDSALDLIGDDAAFANVESCIINDSIEASSIAPPAGAPLREVRTTSPSGHVITKFVGDPAVTWAPFMGGATKFGRITRPKA